MLATRPPFRVRYGGTTFLPIDLAPEMTPLDVKEAIAGVFRLPVGTFSLQSVLDRRGSGFHAGLCGDWEVILLPSRLPAVSMGAGG